MSQFLRTVFNFNSLLSSTKGWAAAFGFFITPFMAAFGDAGKGWVYLLLLSIIPADWITGIAASKKDDTYSSAYGIAGVLRTVLILWLPFIGILLDKASQSIFHVDSDGYAYYSITIGLAYHSWESMTANAVRAGWERWIPKSVVKFVSSEIKAKTKRSAQKNGKST